MVLWMPHHLTRNGLTKVGKKDKSWDETHTFGFEEGRSATEIATAMRLLAAAAREWRPELGLEASF